MANSQRLPRSAELDLDMLVIFLDGLWTDPEFFLMARHFGRMRFQIASP